MNDLYSAVSYRLARQLTLDYSTSFGMSSRLFSRTIRPHIYAIYGLVRIADEIVDTSRSSNARSLLDNLESECYEALKTGYSSNPLVHAFVQTASTFGITRTLIEPFFESMRMDLSTKTYDDTTYRQYIYGSAEVVGLMCLRVFVGGDDSTYASLESPARALGAAYQKVNFLRDIADDYSALGRTYFPGTSFATLDEQHKRQILDDIASDFEHAKIAIHQLPRGARFAVWLSYRYYMSLLVKLGRSPVSTIKTSRIRVSNPYKLWLFVQAAGRKVYER